MYACGPCNGPKNNKFAIFRSGDRAFVEVNPTRGVSSSEPPDGEAALINPRIEDAMNYCILDLNGTFKFVVMAKKGTKEYQKADYTFNMVLRINDQREYLREARKNAYGNYKARLHQYTIEKQKGASQTKLNVMIEGIKKEAHSTVWKEMQRYHKRNILSKVDADLNQYFIDAPEALTW